MKTKPVSHKSSNVFKFQTFSEKLSSIHIDVFHSIHDNREVLPEEEDTFFFEACIKWKELNYSSSFTDFLDELGNECQTLAQVLHHRDHIIELLKKYLDVSHRLAHQPLLELVVALSRDLQYEFYPYFLSFLKCITQLLTHFHHDEEFIEVCFHTLAYLYKFLWRYIVKDLDSVLAEHSCLLKDSQPEHICRFAAQSISFLIRKLEKEKRTKYLKKIISLTADESFSNGISHLLFEVVKGVVGQLHSKHVDVLSPLLTDIEDYSVKSLQTTIQLISAHIELDYNSSLWKLFIDRIHASLSSEEQTMKLLELFMIFINHRRGYHLTQIATLVMCLNTLLESSLMSSAIYAVEFLDYVVKLMLLMQKKCSVDDFVGLAKKVINSACDSSNVFLFVRDISSSPLFITHILPLAIQYSQDKICALVGAAPKTSILVFLAELVNRNRPFPRTKEEASNWTPYPLNYNIPIQKRKKKEDITVPDFLMSCLAADQWMEMNEESGESVLVPEQVVVTAKLAALVVLPHIRPIETEPCVDYCNNMVQLLYTRLVSGNTGVYWLSHLSEDQVLELLVITLQSLLVVCPNIDEQNLCGDKFILVLLQKYPHNIHLLRLSELSLASREGKEGKTPDRLTSFHSVLSSGLHHYSSQVRFYSGRILKIVAGDSVGGLFTVISNSEDVQLTIETYRERIRCLQKLEYSLVQASLSANPEDHAQYIATPVLYLCGQLHVQFRLLWKPCYDLLGSYARGMKPSHFWEIFHKVFSHACESVVSEIENGDQSSLIESSITIELLDVLNKHWIVEEVVQDRWLKYRSQLVNVMCKFPDICETKNRLIVPVFLQFLENEYYKEDFALTQYEDLAHSVHVSEDVVDTSEALDNPEETELPEQKRKLKRKKSLNKQPDDSIGRSEIGATLLAFMEIFSKFQSPKSIYKGADLRSFYEESLKSRNSKLQRMSFQCLMAFQPEFLIPYRGTIQKVIGTEHVKDSMIELENLEVQDIYREGFISIVFRILLGKLYTGSPQTKAIIMRYFSTLEEKELCILWDLVFGIFKLYPLENLSKKSLKVFTEKINERKCFPLKRQQTALKFLQLVFERLGNLLESHLSRFILYILTMGITDSVILQKHANESFILTVSVVRSVRSTRNLVIETLTKFYETFDHYAWSEKELDALITYLVNPQLDTLHLDGIYSPTAIMKLFLEWSRNSRYFYLFVKYPRVLEQILKLKKHPQCDHSVVVCISRIFRNLLTLDKDENDVKGVEGAGVLSPYKHQLLEYLELTVYKAQSSLLSEDDTIILLNVTSMVSEPDSFQRMLDVLVPLLCRKAVTAITVHLLDSINNMLTHVRTPLAYSRYFVSLFKKVSDYDLRLGLCKILMAMCREDEQLLLLAENVQDINMNDPLRLEEPDYDRRMKGYSGLDDGIQNDFLKNDVDILMVIIYNCHYMLSKYNDMAIQDRSVGTLFHAVNYIATLEHERKKEVINQFLDCIKTGLELKDENRRHQYIHLLSHMAKTCRSCHVSLEELSQLHDDDDEVDFFCNLRHIQPHRRGRALKRLNSSINKKKYMFSEVTITEFLLKTASIFLFEEKYVKFEQLVDNAISLIGTLVKRLSWKPYLVVVQQYMSQLAAQEEHQKQAVKVVCCVLDNFHWDLQNNPKILESIRHSLLPWLKKMLTIRTRSQVEHKVNLDHQETENVLKRIPLAIAMVRLMKVLPDDVMANELPAVLLKLCQFLKSRADYVREVCRKTLVTVMKSLGPRQLPCLISQLRPLLTRGYQIHVLSHTLHQVIRGLTDSLSVGDMDCCYGDILGIVQDEMFGASAAEKEVRQITAKVVEARSNKSWEMLSVLGRFTSRNLFLKLLEPFSSLLGTTSQHLKLTKIQQCLGCLAQGFSENQALDTKSYFLFIHGIVSLTMITIPKREQDIDESKQKDPRRPDIYLIPPDPRKKPSKPKLADKTNDHVLVEFGFNLFLLIVKKNRIHLGQLDWEMEAMLNPIVSKMVESLNSDHPKITTLSLKCLYWVVRQDAPLAARHFGKMIPVLFVILHQFCGEVTTHENLEMISLAFKCISVMLSKCERLNLRKRELRVLLTYIEQDVADQTKQAAAFDLLLKILQHRLVCPELAEFMHNIKTLSITSEIQHVRGMARKAFLYYLLNYPLGRKVKGIVNFYLGQLEYEYETGRTSALEMISSIVDNIPPEMMTFYGPDFFISLSACLVNDESETCRKMAAITLVSLVNKQEQAEKEKLFTIIMAWLADKVVNHQKLGVQLLGLFCDIEKKGFRHHYQKAKPHIMSILDLAKPSAEKTGESETALDQLLFQTVRTLLKVSVVLPDLLLLDPTFWETLQDVLVYPHLWVRHTTNQLFGQLFSSCDVVNRANDKPGKNFLLDDTRNKVLRLSSDFVQQMEVDEISDEIMDQLIKNMVYLSRMAVHLVCLKTKDFFTLNFMMRKMSKVAKTEVVKNPKCGVKRSSVFKWFAALALEFPRKHELWEDWCQEYLGLALPVLVREIDDPYGDSDVKNLAQEVVDMLKTKISMELFTRVYSTTHIGLRKKKSLVKVEKAEAAIKKPHAYARAKVKKQQAKVKAKKRKIQERKEGGGKKRKLKNLAIVTS